MYISYSHTQLVLTTMSENYHNQSLMAFQEAFRYCSGKEFIHSLTGTAVEKSF